jgi:hypothetical protein
VRRLRSMSTKTVCSFSRGTPDSATGSTRPYDNETLLHNVCRECVDRL